MPSFFQMPGWSFRRLACIALLISTNCIAADKRSSGDTLESLIPQPTGWRNFDWSIASKSAVFSDLRWIKNPEQIIEKNGTLVTHTRQLNAMGAVWSAERWRAGNPESDIQVTLSRDIPAGECSQAALEIGRGLGAPVFSDSSTRDYFGQDNFVEATSLEWQWTIGQTRVGAYCHGSFASAESRRDPNRLVVSYAPIDWKPAIKPSLLLRCTRSSESGGSRSALSDLVIGVSQTPVIVRDKNMVPFENEPPIVNEVRIAFTLKTRDVTIRYAIDRVNGSLRGEARALNDRLVGTITGMCDRTDSATRF